MQEVKSSMIKSVGYDEAKQQLDVQFNNGQIYHYYEVPAAKHQELMAAESIGSHFSKNIRGAYKSTKKVDEQK
jgi:hypothetical protein